MNCRNCGSPIKAIDEFGHFRCEHCRTVHVPTEQQRTVDGVANSGTVIDNADCPRCQLGLQIGVMDHTQVAVCGNCHGVLMRRVDFARTITYRRANWNGAPGVKQPLQDEELSVSAHCPGCLQQMDTFPYAGPGAVVIDHCRHCDAIWIDAGEISRIERAPGYRAAY